MDNSPPLSPFRTTVPGQEQDISAGTPPQRVPPRVPPRQPQMHQWADQISSGEEDSIEELWLQPAKTEPDDWVQRLPPLSRFCCEAVAFALTQGDDAMLEQAKSLLSLRDNLSEVDPVTGRTPLHWACYGGCLALLSLLYETGAYENPDLPDSKGATPLSVAIYSPLLRQPACIIEFLLQKGAQLSKLPQRGNELVHDDCMTITIATYLVAAGLDIDATDRFRESPLLRACTAKKMQLAEYLLQQGADPNRSGLFRRTILHIGNLDPDAASLLISKGAMVDVPDALGMTPLMYAINCENLALVHLLVEHGASLYKKSVDGMSVLEHARQAGEPFIFFILQKMGLLPDTRPASG